MIQLTPSSKLAAVIGSKSITRAQAIKKTWDYIKKNGLQDSKNKRNINADSTMLPLFNNKKQITMFELASLISKNLSK
jgi:chromatin remodeling complex protein RSC6